VVGFDGGYVRNRHRRPERNFEVVAGKALDRDGQATRFAFVRDGGSEAVSAVGLALRHCGVNEATSVTVLTDGDAGLRAIHQQIAPHADHILDWFHISMKFTNLQQLARGINVIADGGVRSHALAEIDHAKWRLWNGLTERGIVGLIHLGQWAEARCFEHIPSLKKLALMLPQTIRYLELNADSMPDYGKRYRAGQRISTGFVESGVNEIIAKRMVKKQQMRWNRHTVQRFLDVRIHVLNGTLEDAFRHWPKASDLSLTKPTWLSQHDQPTTLHTLFAPATVEFGRFAEQDRKQRGEGKPQTFDFLGFTHISGKDRNGSFALKRKTISKRMRAKLLELKQQLRTRMHDPIALTGKWLKSVAQGYLNYHAVPGNTDSLHAFRNRLVRLWRTMLIHRSQRHHLNWARMRRLADRWLPHPRVLHPYPRVRFDAMHPR